MSDIGAMLARAMAFYIAVAVLLAFIFGALVGWGFLKLLS